jgi:glycosyltransferase A (GT-A) superfamily protein (DUF2064 family)
MTGTFQYFLLYTCPQPGKTAERLAASAGEKGLLPMSSI